MAAYNVNASQGVVLRLGGAAGTAHHQTDNGLLWAPAPQNIRFYQDAPLTNVAAGGVLRAFELQNRSGSTCNCGIGFRIQNNLWIGGRYASDGSAFTDLTSTFQAQSAATLQVVGADQTGFVIGCRIPFDAVSVNITTAETNAGGSTVADHAVQFSNVAGSGWTTVTSAMTFTDNFTLTNTVYTNTVKDFVWQHSNVWGAWTSTVLPVGYYYLRFTSAEREATDVAAVATGVEIYAMLAMEGLEDGDIYANDSADFSCSGANGLVGYFSVADAGNTIKAHVITG